MLIQRFDSFEDMAREIQKLQACGGQIIDDYIDNPEQDYPYGVLAVVLETWGELTISGYGRTYLRVKGCGYLPFGIARGVINPGKKEANNVVFKVTPEQKYSLHIIRRERI